MYNIMFQSVVEEWVVNGLSPREGCTSIARMCGRGDGVKRNNFTDASVIRELLIILSFFLFYIKLQTFIYVNECHDSLTWSLRKKYWKNHMKGNL